jgi:Transposase
MIFVGVDWAEAHHDVCILDEEGDVLARKRIPDSLAGVNQLHAMIADHLSEENDAERVIVGIETERGLLVTALIAAGYQLFAINPLAASRYRERHHVSGAKSDPGDAKVLADLVRTDRHNHRALAADSVLSDAIKLLARNHQNTIWECQRQVNTLRSALKDYYPGALEAFGTEFSGPDAVAILAIAATPRRVAHSPRPASRPPCARPGVDVCSKSARRGFTTCSSASNCASRRSWRTLTASPPRRPSPTSRNSTRRSPNSRRRCRCILNSTRVPRSSSLFQEWGRSSALGCWASSGMTRTTTPTPSLAKTTLARRRSPRRRESLASCSRATAEIRVWPARWTSGRSVLSCRLPELGPAWSHHRPEVAA